VEVVAFPVLPGDDGSVLLGPGAAELGDQRVGLVLDVPAVVEEMTAHVDGPRALGIRHPELPL